MQANLCNPCVRAGPQSNGGEGGILTQSVFLSYHLFSNLHDNRINTGDFCGLDSFNSFNYKLSLGAIISLAMVRWE
jgi:hypothetical protein